MKNDGIELCDPAPGMTSSLWPQHGCTILQEYLGLNAIYTPQQQNLWTADESVNYTNNSNGEYT